MNLTELNITKKISSISQDAAMMLPEYEQAVASPGEYAVEGASLGTVGTLGGLGGVALGKRLGGNRLAAVLGLLGQIGLPLVTNMGVERLTRGSRANEMINDDLDDIRSDISMARIMRGAPQQYMSALTTQGNEIDSYLNRA